LGWTFVNNPWMAEFIGHENSLEKYAPSDGAT
jgi:hypothetical protein